MTTNSETPFVFEVGKTYFYTPNPSLKIKVLFVAEQSYLVKCVSVENGLFRALGEEWAIQKFTVDKSFIWKEYIQ